MSFTLSSLRYVLVSFLDPPFVFQVVIAVPSIHLLSAAAQFREDVSVSAEVCYCYSLSLLSFIIRKVSPIPLFTLHRMSA